MFTTCPACRMNLAVTATDLRLGQGYVRCGRCERVFNALMSLADDLDQEEQSGLAARGTTSLPAIQAEEPVLEEPEVDEPVTEEPAVEEPEQIQEEDQAEAQDQIEVQEIAAPEPAESEAVVPNVDVTDSAGTGTVETIVLEGDTYLQTEEHLDVDEVRERLRDFSVEGEPESRPEEIDADAAVGNPPRAHWAWRVAVVLLLLVLGGQVVHHYRQTLVAEPWLEKPLRALYGLFGVDLEPVWDLAAYELRRLGGEELATNSTTVVLRATVQNHAPHAQPPPLIRVRLQDRFGNTLSSSALEPVDYMNGTPPARMAADQRLDVELRVEDPGRQAAGFDLDACLPATDGKPRCAHDP
jgi:predicted Zn finger-like uncharacterized protein